MKPSPSLITTVVVGAASATVSTVMSSAADSLLTLPATSVWNATTWVRPLPSAMSMLKLPPTTVPAPRVASEPPCLPLPFTSLNKVTTAPSSPKPVIVNPEVFLVRLSLLVPVVPAPKVSSAASRSRAVGAATVVSMTTAWLVVLPTPPVASTMRAR